EPVEELEELEDVAPLESVDGHENDAPVVLESPLEAQPVEEPAAQESPQKKRPVDYDVSEDISQDFFVKKDEPGQKNSPPAQKGAGQNDPFYKVRDSFAPNEETEELVSKFSIDGLDYKELDVENDEQKINGAFETEKNEPVTELTPEDFGIPVEAEKKAFAEPLEFGAPQKQDDDDGFDVASTFTTETPRFERNPLKAFAKAERPSVGQTPAGAEQTAAAAIPVSNKESFMFSSFGQDSNFSELQAADYNAIVEDENGVFSIIDDVQTGGVVQDNSFKRLVESVLNKD
ncbi:MAG: hypothetical protein II814_05290, partial [Treponema sp.]|nr:hypothetical protein [Treponema sp.]